MSVLSPIATSTDADLLRRVWLFLQQHRLINSDQLVIEVHRGVVTLRGHVATYHRRQLVVSAARRVAGVLQVDDQLEVPTPRVARGSQQDFAASAGAFASLLALVAIVFVAGCGGSRPPRVATHPAKGSISYQGQPIAGAFLALHPKASAQPNVPTSTAIVQNDGSFTVTTYESGDGLPEGDYIVTAQWRKVVKSGGEFVPGPDLLPARYSRPETSDVVIRVASGSNALPPIALTR
jgi:hypothetical protein